jgi:hypothetical protein
MAQIPGLFQVRHNISDTGGAQMGFESLGNDARTDGHRRLDEVIDDMPQDAFLALKESV